VGQEMGARAGTETGDPGRPETTGAGEMEEGSQGAGTGRG
jgi:hypothetical protein